REGAVEKVKTFLGRHYSLVGKVVKGHRIGHDLGYPTVNINPIDANKLIPSIGVYICWIIINSKIYQSVTNIGYSPTLKKTGIMEVETHILDFKGDIYGDEVEVVFLKKIREELIFPDRAALIEAIGSDIHTAREYFSQNKEN
ncbi:MAG: riboflavin kinase, partial [Candidatus Cloacimonetes bacterium]|nr:riboflavin kinase [Candidatus Cloacimonadota bacterium]